MRKFYQIADEINKAICNLNVTGVQNVKALIKEIQAFEANERQDATRKILVAQAKNAMKNPAPAPAPYKPAPKGFRNIIASIVRETAAAYLVKVELDISGINTPSSMRRSKFAEIWFPKSQVQIDGKEFYASEWILSAKARELNASFN